MPILIKQASSLEKIRSLSDIKNQITKKYALKGETVSFQQALYSENNCEIKVSVESELSEFINLYCVKNSVMDFPCYAWEAESEDTDFLTYEPGVMPDLLVPLKNQNGYIRFRNTVATVWVEVNVPKDFPAGIYEIKINYNGTILKAPEEAVSFTKSLNLEVVDAVLPKQEIKVTQWFHTDCIADIHNVPVYSEKHWELIDKYMKEAKKQCLNMILTPVITPPLDTKFGELRPNVQLVKITKNNEKYEFDFSYLKRFIALALKNGMEYFEISHLFSQWGLRYSPNIYVWENGEEKRLFGWHILATDDSYREFLSQFLPELTEFLKEEEVLSKCYFHISDEPGSEQLDAYRYAYELVSPYLKDAKIMDALSDVEFYNTGLVKIPVTAISHIDSFLEKDVPEQWVYYCCVGNFKSTNRFLAMPSHRNKILGLQLYKFGIKGFLQWGFNFYYSQFSVYKINPYLTTSSDCAFPSGDPFSVYPGNDEVLPSLRAKVFGEAIMLISLLKKLESYIGYDKVISFIEEKAGMEITFREYPKNSEFLNMLDEEIKIQIKKEAQI